MPIVVSQWWFSKTSCRRPPQWCLSSHRLHNWIFNNARPNYKWLRQQRRNYNMNLRLKIERSCNSSSNKPPLCKDSNFSKWITKLTTKIIVEVNNIDRVVLEVWPLPQVAIRARWRRWSEAAHSLTLERWVQVKVPLRIIYKRDYF